MTQRSRAWCFTINNYTKDDKSQVRALRDLAIYMIVGREKQTLNHLQGYVYLENARSLRSMSKKLTRAHFEIAKGSPKQNRKYCSKEHKFREYGTLPEQGRRSDLESIKTQLDEGESLENIAEKDFSRWVIHRRAFSEYRDMIRSKHVKPEIFVYTGEDIEEDLLNNCEIEDVYFSDYFDDWRGYDHQSIVVLAETWSAMPCIRRLIMGIPTRMKIPYGTVLVNPKQIIVMGQKNWNKLNLDGEKFNATLTDDCSELQNLTQK